MATNRIIRSSCRPNESVTPSVTHLSGGIGSRLKASMYDFLGPQSCIERTKRREPGSLEMLSVPIKMVHFISRHIQAFYHLSPWSHSHEPSVRCRVLTSERRSRWSLSIDCQHGHSLFRRSDNASISLLSSNDNQENLKLDPFII